MFDLLSLTLFCCLAIVGYVAGRFTEQRHYRSIRTRERELADVLVFASRFPVLSHADNQVLVAGSVVIAEDYFKRIASGLQSLFGGRLKSYESLIDRARREAILRMKQEALTRGARMIFNVKFQTFSIPSSRNDSGGAVEVLAYGTGLVRPI
jgi:uncharacterized protein YbjQ (UPF0145 family)